jgi:long-chain acyl-CoA synthetase
MSTSLQEAPFTWSEDTADAIVRGHPARVYTSRRHSLAELLLDARRWADRAMLVQGTRRVTYRDHESAVADAADALRKQGAGPGTRIMLAGINSIEWVVGFWAAVATGATVALANFWWSEAELAAAIDAVDPIAILADRSRLAPLPPAARVIELGELGNLGPRPGQPARTADMPEVDEDASALIVFTSGSTGQPRGAVLTHHGIIAAQQNLLVATRRLPQQLSADDPAPVSLLTAPLFHLGGIGPLITGMIVGGRMVFLSGRFDAAEVLDLIETERVTVWGGVPTMMQRVLNEPSITRRDLSSVRTIGLGGAPVPPDLPDRIRAAFPRTRRGVSEVYGMTETCGFIASASGQDLLDRPGTTGRPLPVIDIKIVDQDADGAGRILVRGPTVMLGYVGDPPGAALDADGYFATGDLGRLDTAGYLYITGRSKDVIIRAGENISAAHVEGELTAHPAVAEAAVLALPHPDLGEEVAAVVVIKGTVTPRELAAFLRDRLAYFEVPSRWWLRAKELPTTAYGKPDKKLLRASWPGPSSVAEESR